MFTLLVTYAHLLAACLALGPVLIEDWRLFRGRHHPIRFAGVFRLMDTRRTVTASLAVLWATGALLVALGYSQDPGYLANAKLWAKITVVVVLTINGLLLHRYAFPRIAEATVLMELPERERFGFAVLAAVSAGSWLFAAFLGIARSWNYAMEYGEIAGIFLAMLAVAVLAAVALLAMPAARKSCVTGREASSW